MTRYFACPGSPQVHRELPASSQVPFTLSFLKKAARKPFFSSPGATLIIAPYKGVEGTGRKRLIVFPVESSYPLEGKNLAVS
jgi:hypothetical protein